MHNHAIQWEPAERLQIEYTAKPVSGWGGLIALVRYWDRLGLRLLLHHALPDGRRSPNQIPAVAIARSRRERSRSSPSVFSTAQAAPRDNPPSRASRGGEAPIGRDRKGPEGHSFGRNRPRLAALDILDVDAERAASGPPKEENPLAVGKEPASG